MKGNPSRALLKKVDLLESKVREDLGTDTVEKITPLLSSIRALSKVIGTTFGQTLKDGFLGDILAFKEMYVGAGIKITPKVSINCHFIVRDPFNILQAHILFQHVPEFLEAANKSPSPQPLGIYLINNIGYNKCLCSRVGIFQRAEL